MGLGITFPRTRGVGPEVDNGPTFPAYAGLFRGFPGFHSDISTFPRIRGVVPYYQATKGRRAIFPRSRGVVPGHLFPAYAGLFRWNA